MGRLTRGDWVGWAVVVGAFALGMAPGAGAQPWIMEPLPTVNGATLVAVSCSSSVACMAVGNIHLATGYSLPLSERWDGQSWSVETPVTPSGAGGGMLVHLQHGLCCRWRLKRRYRSWVADAGRALERDRVDDNADPQSKCRRRRRIPVRAAIVAVANQPKYVALTTQRSASPASPARMA